MKAAIAISVLRKFWNSLTFVYLFPISLDRNKDSNLDPHDLRSAAQSCSDYKTSMARGKGLTYPKTKGK